MLGRAIAGRYWVVYYLVYVFSVAALLWLYWEQLDWNLGQQKETLFLLAAVFGASAGFALLVAIVPEVLGHMVLLIPQAWEKAKSRGRQEGRKTERDRVQDIIARYGQKDPESGAIVITPEGAEQLLKGSGETS